jgi:hypothetical protein
MGFVALQRISMGVPIGACFLIERSAQSGALMHPFEAADPQGTRSRPWRP